MAENEVLRRIQEAKKTKSLDLNSMRLINLPIEVKDIQRLRNINLYRNAFESIPEEILQFNYLENLNIYRNQITEIPKEIRQLSNLRILNLGSNKLTQIDESVFDIVTLEELDLSNNAIIFLSPKIAQLRQLRDLKVFRNKLKILPAEIGELKTLKRLDISYNELVALPSEFSNLTDLQQLTLTENPLRFPPPDVVKRGRQAIQKYLKDDATDATQCEAVGSGLSGAVVGQTATFTVTSKNKVGSAKQVGGDRYEVTLVLLPDQPLESKEELKTSLSVSTPLLNIPPGLASENNINNNSNNNEQNNINDKNATEEKIAEVESMKVNGTNEEEPKKEINDRTTENKAENDQKTENGIKEADVVPTKPDPVVIPLLDLPKKEELSGSRPVSAALSEKSLDAKQLSSSSLLDDSTFRSQTNLETSLDVSTLDTSTALDTSTPLDTSNTLETSTALDKSNAEKKVRKTKSSRKRREKSSDKTDEKKKRRKHKRDRSKKSPRNNNPEISHKPEAGSSPRLASEEISPRQISRSNLKASSDVGKQMQVPNLEKPQVVAQTAPAAIVQQKIQEELLKKKDDRPDLTGQFVVTGNMIDNLDGTYVANYQPTLSGVYDMYITLNGINIKDSPFRISIDADLRAELIKLKELFWAQKKRADALQKELNESKFNLTTITDKLKSEEKAKKEFEQDNIRLKNELNFLKQMAANMGPSQATPVLGSAVKPRKGRRRSNRRSYHPSVINNTLEESVSGSQKGKRPQPIPVSASNDFDGITRQKSAPNWKKRRPSVRRENSEPVPNETQTPSKPKYVPKKIDESVEQATADNTNINSITSAEPTSNTIFTTPRKRSTVVINDEKSNNDSIGANGSKSENFQASAKKRKSDKRRTPSKNKRSSMIIGGEGEDADPKKNTDPNGKGFKEKLNFWKTFFGKKDKEVNYVRKGSRASKTMQNKEEKKNNTTNDKAETKVEESSLEQW